MGKAIVVILPILFLGLLFGCSSSTKSPPKNVLLKMLLPKLDNYGFETQGVSESDKKGHSKFYYGGISRQFNIPASKGTKEQIPVDRVMGIYVKGNETISIIIQKYKNKRVAAKEVKRRVESSKIMRSVFQRGNPSLGFKLKKVRVSGHSAYCQVFSGIPGQKHETRFFLAKLFWANGLYVFELISYGEGSLPEDETIKIAGEIGY